MTTANVVSRNTFGSLLSSPPQLLNLAEMKMLFFNPVKTAFYLKPENKPTTLIFLKLRQVLRTHDVYFLLAPVIIINSSS